MKSGDNHHPSYYLGDIARFGAPTDICTH